MRDIIIVAPSLDPKVTLGGVSSVASFIVNNNNLHSYIHFEQGRRDSEKGFFKRITGLLSKYKSWKKLLDSNPDSVIHYNFPLSFESVIRDFFFMREAVRRNMKMVVHVHGGIYMNTDSMPFFIKKMLRIVFSWQIPFIVLSEKERSIINMRYNSSMIHVLQNCVVVDSIGKQGQFSNPSVLGYIGRISKNKGIGELFEACKIIKEKKYDFELHIAGNETGGTNYISMFQELLGSKFHYAGIVSGEEKKAFLRGLDIFVLPSYFEGLPVSLLECMSYGIIPIVTSVGSIPEVVVDKKNGLLIKDHDVDSLVTEIVFLLEHDEIREAYSQLARKTIIDEYSSEMFFKKLNNIYNSL